MGGLKSSSTKSKYEGLNLSAEQIAELSKRDSIAALGTACATAVNTMRRECLAVNVGAVADAINAFLGANDMHVRLSVDTVSSAKPAKK